MAHPGIVFLDEAPRIRRKSNTYGILGCLFSILGIFTFGLASPIGLLLSLVGMTRRPRGAATVGLVLGGLGTAFLAFAGWAAMAGFSAVEYDRQVAQTQIALARGVDEIEQFHSKQDELPHGITGNKTLISAGLKDAWGNELRYDRLDENNFVVRSAGPDEQFDTSDDLTQR